MDETDITGGTEINTASKTNKKVELMP